MSLQLAVILVPVVFGMMGFALDLGRLYLVRGELTQAADAAAIAAASQLIGTATSLDHAGAVATQAIALNKYNFGSLTLGQDSGNLTSTIADPAYFATVAGALGTDPNGASADGTTARHVQINVTADAPLLFWSLLSLGASRKTPIAAQALAGVSAPLCTACGIEPFAIPAKDLTRPGELRTRRPDGRCPLHLLLQLHRHGAHLPAQLGAIHRVHHHQSLRRGEHHGPRRDRPAIPPRRRGAGVVHHAQSHRLADSHRMRRHRRSAGSGLEQSHLQRRAAGLFGSGTSPGGERRAVRPVLALRQPDAACRLHHGGHRLSARSQPAFQPDTDRVTGQGDIYSSYPGNGRRVITVTVVDALAPNTATPMTVLGFRQFLVQPNPDGTFFDPSDPNGRFVATYIGSPMPVKQGYVDDRFGQSCPAPVTSGPGKVVLHR